MDDLEHFYLSPKESRDMIEFLAKKRKIKNYKRKSSDRLLQAIKENKDKEQQSKNKKRMNIIREKVNSFIKIESKEIRTNFYDYIQLIIVIQLIIIYNTKLFTKTPHKLLYTLFIFIFNY